MDQTKIVGLNVLDGEGEMLADFLKGSPLIESSSGSSLRPRLSSSTDRPGTGSGASTGLGQRGFFDTV